MVSRDVSTIRLNIVETGAEKTIAMSNAMSQYIGKSPSAACFDELSTGFRDTSSLLVAHVSQLQGCPTAPSNYSPPRCHLSKALVDFRVDPIYN